MTTTIPEDGTRTTHRERPDVAEHRTEAEASADIRALSWALAQITSEELPTMDLSAGLRPVADVDSLASSVAAIEYELARRMDAAARAGAVPLAGDGALLRARSWSAAWSRRLARTGAFARQHPEIAGPWSSGRITSEHVDVLARRADELTTEEMAAVVEQLAGRWGRHSPESLARFIQRVVRALHPPDQPEPEETDAYATRALSFAVLGDTVVLTGSLPRLEGEAVMAAVDAWAERLRSAADQVPMVARRADGLVALVNAAAAAGLSRGGLPVALTVTLDRAPAGDAVWSTSRGHQLTGAEVRFAACSGDVTPVLVRSTERCGGDPPAPPAGGSHHSARGPSIADRVAGLAWTLLDVREPLAVGRTQRSATPAQRRALAARDRGCVIPGCGVPAEACQVHHLTPWAEGGETHLTNLVLLCWAHHRQVDLAMWSIEPADPLQPTRAPAAGSPPGTTWPGNNGSPWTVVLRPRSRWRGSIGG